MNLRTYVSALFEHGESCPSSVVGSLEDGVFIPAEHLCNCREKEPDANPGPWHDVDGVYFEVNGKTFGPFSSEDEAEIAFDRAIHPIGSEAYEIDASQAGEDW